MSLLQVSELTFCYEGSFDNIFENTSFSIDTDWKTGFIGRNGKGKTTFLSLLLGKYDYEGSISTDKVFDYFPYQVTESEMDKTVDELSEKWKPGVENWRIICKINSLGVDPEILYRPIRTLSYGERTKAMLAVLFSGENEFLLVDEPTNHLDKDGREIVKNYLSSKKGFILVSHDRDLLDAVCDHSLVLNKASIEVVAGNFTSWWENKQKADAFAIAENEKHMKDRCISTRAYIGAKTKKMQSRVKNFEKRIGREIEEKEGLLNDIEKVDDLKLIPLIHHKKCLVECKNFSLGYRSAEETKKVSEDITFQLMQGDILFLNGENGCGKSTLIKAIINDINNKREAYQEMADVIQSGETGDMLQGGETGDMVTSGKLETASGLVISYINQSTSHLSGSLKEYAKNHNLDYSIFLTLLRKLDMGRVQFEKNIEEYSEGQKKKVLIAASLLTSAHLYIWDEPLNYIDVFSRMQIERLIESFKPTMILVEHDVRFREKLATKVIEL